MLDSPVTERESKAVDGERWRNVYRLHRVVKLLAGDVGPGVWRSPCVWPSETIAREMAFSNHKTWAHCADYLGAELER